MPTNESGADLPVHKLLRQVSHAFSSAPSSAALVNDVRFFV
jgi:hypothetical protein